VRAKVLLGTLFRKGDDLCDLLILGQGRRVDDHGVARSNGLLGVAGVSFPYANGLVVQQLFGGWSTALPQSAERPLTRIGNQEDLQRRVRKYNGAHVAAVHHNVLRVA